jgi:hypothetical protein
VVITEIADIDAPTDVVWRVLTDFDAYEAWNPFALRCASSMVPGEPIDMYVRLGPGKPRKQREWMRTHTPGLEFSYTMKPVPLGALRSLRSQSVTALENGRTRYVSYFELHGWLRPLVTILYGRSMRRGFAGMTAGLRGRAEAQVDT